MASVETSGPTGTRLPAQYRLFAQIVGAVIDPDGVVHDAVRDCTGRVLGATRTEHRHSRRCSGHADVTLAGPAESCSAHRPDSRRDAVVGGLVVQQLQRHPGLCRLLVDLPPGRMGEHALVLASAREHQFVVVAIRAVLDVVPPESGSIGGFEHRRDWLP